jgi:minimal PKS acyl carrier protein
MASFTLDDLRRVMRECAGEDESVNLDGDIADVAFDDLGYDSLARMETASRVQRELGVALPEEEMADVLTPAEFVAFVNSRLVTTA